MGTSLHMKFTFSSGMSSTRPTSLRAALAASVPKVPIWATLSRPYFCLTYSMTSSRRSWQKSMSMSGGSDRLGSRNRSNSRSYSIGQTCDRNSTYATSDPQPLPRAVLGMPSSRAYRTKSQTIRKYAAYPILLMTPSSCSRRANTASPGSAYRSAMPVRQSCLRYLSGVSPSGQRNTGKCRFLKSSWMSTPSAISWLRATAASWPGNRAYMSLGDRT